MQQDAYVGLITFGTIVQLYAILSFVRAVPRTVCTGW